VTAAVLRRLRRAARRSAIAIAGALARIAMAPEAA